MLVLGFFIVPVSLADIGWKPHMSTLFTALRCCQSPSANVSTASSRSFSRSRSQGFRLSVRRDFVSTIDMQIHQQGFFVSTIDMQIYQRGLFREHNRYADTSAEIFREHNQYAEISAGSIS
jgi:hypothetical protein